jgi:hypothetical protein
MILTTHILSGAVVGAEVKNPFAVAGLALILHFTLDLIPHGDYLNKRSNYRDFWKVAVDFLIGFGMIAAILFHHNKVHFDPLYIRNVLIGIFFSLVPDGTTFLYWKLKMKFLAPIKRFHEKLHYYPEFSPGRQFRMRNNHWDILISVGAFLFLFLT